MSIGEAAVHFGVSEKTIRRRIESGRLKAHKVNRRWVVTVASDVQDTVQSNVQCPTDPLVRQLQNENEHLREQVDRLTQLLAVQTHQSASLTKQLQSASRLPFLVRIRNRFVSALSSSE